MNNWTKEKPASSGYYWLSIAPERRSQRRGIQPVMKCEVFNFGGLACGIPKVALVSLDDDMLTGALWRPVDADPVDPFAPSLVYSQDNDLP